MSIHTATPAPHIVQIAREAVRSLAHGAGLARQLVVIGVAVGITKTDSASHLRILDELVSELEVKRGMPVGHTRFNAMVETADAFFRIHEIVQASPRIVSINIGGEDAGGDAGLTG